MQAGEQVFIGAFVAQPPSDDSMKTESGGQSNGRSPRPKSVALDSAVTAPRPCGIEHAEEGSSRSIARDRARRCAITVPSASMPHELLVDQTFVGRGQGPGNAELGREFAPDSNFAPEAISLFRSPPRAR